MRIETLYFKSVDKMKYPKLWGVLEELFLISVSTASVERQFSLNKSMLFTNIQENTLKARKTVRDGIITDERRTKKEYDITKEMIKECSLAYGRYNAEQAKIEQQAKSNVDKQQQCLSDLNKEKEELELSIILIEEKADKLAERAEAEKKMSLVVQSNCLRRGLAVKRKRVAEISLELSQKVKKIQ